MEPLRLDAARLACALDVTPGLIVRLIADQQPVASDLALRLARCFRTSPQFWLGLQAAYDLAVAEAEHGAEIAARVHTRSSTEIRGSDPTSTLCSLPQRRVSLFGAWRHSAWTLPGGRPRA